MRTKCQVPVPLSPPWKLLNIPLSVPASGRCYSGSYQQRGERSRERQGENGPGEVEGDRRPGKGAVPGGSTKEDMRVLGGRPQRAVSNPPVHRKSDRESQRNAPFKAELVSSADELGKMGLNWATMSSTHSYFFISTEALWLGQSPSPLRLQA